VHVCCKEDGSLHELNQRMASLLFSEAGGLGYGCDMSNGTGWHQDDTPPRPGTAFLESPPESPKSPPQGVCFVSSAPFLTVQDDTAPLSAAAASTPGNNPSAMANSTSVNTAGSAGGRSRRANAGSRIQSILKQQTVSLQVGQVDLVRCRAAVLAQPVAQHVPMV